MRFASYACSLAATRAARGTSAARGGVIGAVRGTYPLPDDGPRQREIEPVYSVAFGSEDVFGVRDETSWMLYLDLHESYLEAA